jgi:2,3-bisphosphoglycerate-independent phosphoglycerate mutase
MVFDIFKKREKTDLATHIENSIKPVVLISLDGYGVAPPSEGNAIYLAKKPNIDFLQNNFLYGELIASGESVGLPAGEVGNSEVGHLTMGIGTVLFQSLKRISAAIEDSSFYENPAFISAFEHIRKNNSKLHIMGLVGSGAVHSSVHHLFALMEFCRRVGARNVYYHLFTDGRDAPPTDGINVITKIDEKIHDLKFGQIATISGRYYAMDRDKRWERTKLVYNAMVLGQGIYANSAVEAVRKSYADGKTDEFIEPTVILKNDKPVSTIDNNDAAIFFNFRVDRPRQLTMSFVMPDFEKLDHFYLGEDPEHKSKEESVVSGKTFKREKLPENLFFVTMTQYQKELPVSAIAFPPLKAKTSLPKILSDAGLKHLHLTESEKERMVTIYFDGLRDERLPGEDVIIVPSPRVATYDKKPEMNVYGIVEEFKKQINRNYYHFYIMNFANPDMVAHSGNVKATVKAIEHVDKVLGEVYKEVLKKDGTLFITADHGNAEEMLTFPSSSYFFTTREGDVNTDHSSNPVPLFIVSNKFYKSSRKLPKGTLSDIAPTILSLMGFQIPQEMTGRDLLEAEKAEDAKNVSTKIIDKKQWIPPDI